MLRRAAMCRNGCTSPAPWFLVLLAVGVLSGQAAGQVDPEFLVAELLAIADPAFEPTLFDLPFLGTHHSLTALPSAGDTLASVGVPACFIDEALRAAPAFQTVFAGMSDEQIFLSINQLFLSTQLDDISTQLRNGVRAFGFRPRCIEVGAPLPPFIVHYHELCNYGELMSAYNVIREFMDTHTSEVVILQFENFDEQTGFSTACIDKFRTELSMFDDILIRRSDTTNGWPPLRSLIADNKRLLVLGEGRTEAFFAEADKVHLWDADGNLEGAHAVGGYVNTATAWELRADLSEQVGGMSMARESAPPGEPRQLLVLHNYMTMQESLEFIVMQTDPSGISGPLSLFTQQMDGNVQNVNDFGCFLAKTPVNIFWTDAFGNNGMEFVQVLAEYVQAAWGGLMPPTWPLCAPSPFVLYSEEDCMGEVVGALPAYSNRSDGPLRGSGPEAETFTYHPSSGPTLIKEAAAKSVLLEGPMPAGTRLTLDSGAQCAQYASILVQEALPADAAVCVRRLAPHAHEGAGVALLLVGGDASAVEVAGGVVSSGELPPVPPFLDPAAYEGFGCAGAGGAQTLLCPGGWEEDAGTCRPEVTCPHSWGHESVAHCELGSSWEELAQSGAFRGPQPSAWTGGLGRLMEEQFRVWLCTHAEGRCGAESGGGLFCWVFDEAAGRFVPWAANQCLQLVNEAMVV